MNFAGNLKARNLVSGAITAWFVRISGNENSEVESRTPLILSPPLFRLVTKFTSAYVNIKLGNIFSEGTKEINSGMHCVGGKRKELQNMQRGKALQRVRL
jgi:hypothetical protein